MGGLLWVRVWSVLIWEQCTVSVGRGPRTLCVRVLHRARPCRRVCAVHRRCRCRAYRSLAHSLLSLAPRPLCTSLTSRRTPRPPPPPHRTMATMSHLHRQQRMIIPIIAFQARATTQYTINARTTQLGARLRAFHMAPSSSCSVVDAQVLPVIVGIVAFSLQGAEGVGRLSLIHI